MNIRDAKRYIPALVKHNIVPFIWGRQGIGKTQTIKQMADDLKINFVHLHLATQEVGDLVGLLVHTPEGNVKHARPEWFPTDGEGIIFLDELNRAHPDVIQAMFSFITSKTIHQHKLPNGWKIVAAGNYQSDEFNVTDTSDAAWMSRFCHLHLTPSAEEFVVHAENMGAGSVADFISDNKEMLETKLKENVEIAVTPDRRAWLEMVAPLDSEHIEDEPRYELYSGIVGSIAAARYLSYLKSNTKKIKLSDILHKYDSVRSKILEFNKEKDTRFDALSSPLEELIVRLGDSKFVLDKSGVEGLKRFMLDIPIELVSQTVKKLSKMNFVNKDALLNDSQFNKKLLKNEKA